jgi:two-component system chemotaxis sensor kinase CheA
VVGEVRDRAAAEQDQRETALAGQDQHRTVLLFQNGERERMAIELSQVARLEEFAPDVIEMAGDREVVQYRGQIMPLIRVSDVLQTPRQRSAESDSEPLQVVVCREEGRSVGLVIDRILDIVEGTFVIQPDTGRTGVLGSAVIQARTTGVLDVRSLLAAAETRAKTVAAHA